MTLFTCKKFWRENKPSITGMEADGPEEAATEKQKLLLQEVGGVKVPEDSCCPTRCKPSVLQ